MHACPHTRHSRAARRGRDSRQHFFGGQEWLPHDGMSAYPAPDDDPFLMRAIILRAWVEVADAAEARAFLARHTARLRDPIAIALLTGWARQTDDIVLADVLLCRRDTLLGHCAL